MIPMTQLHSGKLRAIGYDAPSRTLRIELEGGACWEYHGVGSNVWSAFMQASTPWSYYRDNIEEAYTAKRASTQVSSGGQNPLDDLFK